MKLVSFCQVEERGADPEGVIGVVDGERLVSVGGLGLQGQVPSTMLDLLRAGPDALARLRAAFERIRGTEGEPWRPVASVRLLAPVRRPGKIVAIGLNYLDHAREQDAKLPEEPLVFAKFASSVIGPGDDIVLPVVSDQVDHEVELAVLIGREARHVSREEAAGCVAGYTIVNDVTARDLQKRDRQWVRAKSLDTFCPMGPCIVTADEFEFPPARDVCLRVNGETRQASNTRQLIFDVPDLVSRLSRAFTLEPGDIISTGTPAGVGVFRNPPIFLKAGDVVEAEIDGIGTLVNRVVAPRA